MARVGYARVSTTDQTTAPQTDALTAAGCERIFTEKASGKLTKRVELDKALDYLRPGDALVITKLDRLGRSLPHLLQVSALLREREIDLIVLTQGIDTTTPVGRLYFAVIGAIAEFERELIVERTQDGLAAARARGRSGGRPKAMSPEQIALAREMHADGKRSITEIATTLKVSRSTLHRELARTETPEANRADS